MRRIALTLHAHLPFYPPDLDQPNPAAGEPSFGSRWLLENVVECYLPLLRSLKRLQNVSANKLNLSFSPVLVEQLASPRTKRALVEELDELRARARSDARRLQGLMRKAAQRYEREFSDLLEFYLAIDRDLIGEFSRLTNVELMTTALTHAFLPLLKYHDAACAFQLTEAARQTRNQFGRPVRGLWFPEMGYTPYVRKVVSDHFEYFLVAPSAVSTWDGNAYRNRLDRRYGVVDLAASSLIWHPQVSTGEPIFARNAVYREFYKWDTSSGLKYWAITRRDVPLGEKAPYSPTAAARQVERDVPDCLRLLSRLRSDRLLATDAEFFGHHWYEGSDFLYQVLKHSEEYGVRFVANSDLIVDSEAEVPEVEPRESCWGSTGVWMGPDKIAEIRIDILARTEKALSLFQTYREEDDYYRRMLLNRLLKELVAIQASDYAFAVYTATSTHQYDRIVARHRASFDALADQIAKPCSYCERRAFLSTLREIAKVNYLFRDMDYRSVELAQRGGS
jgi:1,4-alpha-glucan branching enzyme